MINHKDGIEDCKEFTSSRGSEDNGLIVNPTHPTHPTQNTSLAVLTTKEQQSSQANPEEIDISDKIYRLGSTDLWACKYCKLSGDTWFMKKHLCKRTTK